MISTLENYPIQDYNGDVVGESIPTQQEIINKINEIVRYLNENSETIRGGE